MGRIAFLVGFGVLGGATKLTANPRFLTCATRLSAFSAVIFVFHLPDKDDSGCSVAAGDAQMPRSPGLNHSQPGPLPGSKAKTSRSGVRGSGEGGQGEHVTME